MAIFMLRLILGRAASGKTTYIRNIIAEKVKSGGLVTLIVPEQFSFESEKAVIEMLGAKTASLMNICSFTSLSEKIIGEYEKDRKPSVTDAAKTVIMSLALEALSEHLEIFSGCSKNKRTVSELLHMTDELIMSSVLPEDIESAANKMGNEALIKKSREISLIAKMYEALLTERFSDDRYLINSAAEIIARERLFEGHTVFFDEFMSFTAQENLIISEMLKQAENVYITQCADGITDASGGTGAFSYSVGSIAKLISLANKCGTGIAEPVILKRDARSVCEPLGFLERGAYSSIPEIYEGETDKITVVSAGTLYDECEFIAMTAKKLVRKTGIRYRDIVVVSRSEDYARYLPFSFKKYGIPVFEDKRHALDSELIVIFAVSALSLAAEGLNTDCMFRYLKTYLTDISEDDIAELENYVFIWRIDYGKWLTDWTENPEGLGKEFDEEAKERLDHLNDIRKKAVTPILKLKNGLAQSDGTGCTEALYDFILSVGADKRLFDFAMRLDAEKAYECSRSWDEFMSVLSLLADTLGNRTVTPSRYLELFKIMVSSSDIGSLPGGIDEITVGNSDRIRVGDKKVLFIAGANAGVFPAEAEDSFVLTRNERGMLKNQGVELTGDSIDTMMKERLGVYRTLSLPSERLFISYSLGNFKGEASAPSEIVAMADKIVPNHKKIDFSLLEPMYFVESRQSAFESAMLHYSDETAYSSSVREYVFSLDMYGGMAETIESAVKKSPVRIYDTKKAEELFGTNMRVTPSRIEEYYKCPFRYFCRYGLNAKKLERASFDPKQNGLIVHYVLEKLFSEYGSHGLTELTADERKKAVSETVNSYIDKYMGGREALEGRLLYSLERSKITVEEILERLVREFTLCKFETRDVELKIGDDGSVKPYIVDFGTGKAIIGGVVDRVDTMDAGNGRVYIRVIDYKTGGKDFNINDILSGLNIQMLVYLICLTEKGYKRYGDMIPAGILYVAAKKGKNELPRNATDEDLENLMIKNGKMKGMVLGEPEVIYGMDASGKGRLIEAKISDGAVSGKTFDLHGFALLHRAVDGIIRKMARSLHGGKIEIMPILDGAYKNTCEYCDYKTVCRREKTDEYAALFKGDVWETLETMEAQDNG